MTDQESNDLLNTIFPVGKERWIRVKYLDRKKCIDSFRLGHHTEESLAHAKEVGYEVTAIGVRDEYKPQFSAIMDLKTDVIAALSRFFRPDEDHMLDQVNEIFKNKLDELKPLLIKDVPIDGIKKSDKK